MKRLLISAALVLCISMCVSAQTINVDAFRFAGPYAVQKPFEVDSVNIKGSAFKFDSILDSDMSFEALKNAATVSSIPASDKEALNLIGFSAENKIYCKADIKIEGLKSYRLYVDGNKCEDTSLKLEPGTHDFVIKCLTSSEEGADSLKITLTPEKEGRLTLRSDGKRMYSLDINSNGIGCGGASISANGKYIALGHKMTENGGKTSTWYDIIQVSDGKVLMHTRDYVSWMPSSDAYWFTRPDAKGRSLYSCDPGTGIEKLIYKGLPDGYFNFTPTEDALIYSMTQEGPTEGEVHQILEPDDRQPGWRDRSYLALFNLSTGVMQPLTFGWHNSYLTDMSDDGKKILFMTSRERLEKRPTTLFSLYIMDLATLSTECLIQDEGHMSDATFSPDASQILVTGTPEAFNGVGMDVKPGQIPNGYDVQLFVFTIKDKSVKPLTKKFNPSILNAVWSKYDGKIYLSAEDKDCRNLFRIDPKNAKYESLKNKEEYVQSFDMSNATPTLIYYGESLSNGQKVYTLDTKSGKQSLLYDFSAERLDGVQLGEGFAYEFKSSRGDLINGFYVLPPDFDPSKKYPLLVHYYGGCSPSARYCIGAYSPQWYAAQGYVFYVINPSGASGFGQEFAARHVNTAGDGVAEDIIEGTERFCQDHPYIDKDHIGCFSASYGGFITQLLLTKTDIYATGISHAGISDHTSYWGEGYWGYSYSEVSMADSYPWTRKDLYVDRSPLYNADKIHTPLLFLHGSADTNVPIGESIQMFTALKLLGAETAFVVVDGENHGVETYGKRRQWLRTISAWFSKYLMEDDTWWNELYPQKNL